MRCMPVEERALVALQQCVDPEPHLAAQGGIEPARESEVDEQQPRARRGGRLVEHEQVARVRVGVEQPVDEDLLRVGARQDLEHRRAARPASGRGPRDRRCERRAVAHRQHAARGVAREDARHDHARVVREVRRDLRRDARFALEVELFAQAGGELGEQPFADRRRRGAAQTRAAQRSPTRDRRAAKSASHGYWTFTATRSPLVQARAVHLGDRGGAERLALEVREQHRERRAELGFDRGAHLREGQGRHLVAQRRERRGHRGGQQVVAVRGELAGLHEGTLEIPEGCGQPRGGASLPAWRRAAARAAALEKGARSHSSQPVRRGSPARRRAAAAPARCRCGAARAAGRRARAPRRRRLRDRALDGGRPGSRMLHELSFLTPRESVVYSIVFRGSCASPDRLSSQGSPLDARVPRAPSPDCSLSSSRSRRSAVSGHDFSPRTKAGEIDIYDDLFSVSVADEQHAVAVGYHGSAYWTEDGGDSWHKGNTGSEELLYSVSLADSHNGWAVGQTGTILRTTDGGKTWELQPNLKVGRGLSPVRGPGDRREHRLGGGRVGHAHPHQRRRRDLDGRIAHDRHRASDVRLALDAGPGARAQGREGLRGRRHQQRLLPAGAQPEVLARRRVRLHLLVRRSRRDLESRRDPGLRAHRIRSSSSTTRSRSGTPTRSSCTSSRHRSSTPRT